MNSLNTSTSESSPGFSRSSKQNQGPISFMLHLDGREEAVKVVEPKMDVPLPQKGRLLVKDRDVVWCNVVFVFNPESDRPYELYFQVLMGVIYAADHRIAFGTPLEQDRNLQQTHEMEVVDRGGVKAWIEMTWGKARLVIHTKGG